MMQTFLAYALFILMLALPYIVLVLIGIGLIWGVVLVARGALGSRWALLVFGMALVAFCGTAALFVRTSAKNCPQENAPSNSMQRMIHEQTMQMRFRAASMAAARSGTVLGHRLPYDPCSVRPTPGQPH